VLVAGPTISSPEPPPMRPPSGRGRRRRFRRRGEQAIMKHATIHLDYQPIRLVLIAPLEASLRVFCLTVCERSRFFCIRALITRMDCWFGSSTMSMPFVIRPGVCGHWEFEIQSQNHIVHSFCSQALTQACYGRVQKRKKKKGSGCGKVASCRGGNGL